MHKNGDLSATEAAMLLRGALALWGTGMAAAAPAPGYPRDK